MTGPTSQGAARPRSNLTSEEALRGRASCSTQPLAPQETAPLRLWDQPEIRRRPQRGAPPSVAGRTRAARPASPAQGIQQQNGPAKPAAGTANGALISEGPLEEK
ncbi:hypothetical protein NDU88_011522 [Pleurodeles waltl]|uniref:Uncharacterized protein n=1 Tax=Pleurodeles waltl TaxID=8319 RepID=A0AAV7S1E9_PLEWA|nr:hypothetical protein NDU88_011522 [Pleurodeles waltl]